MAADPDGAACDLPAGPSEVLVLADDSARAEFVAADLLAQAEHDPLAQAILVTDSRALAQGVVAEIAGTARDSSRAQRSWMNRCESAAAFWCRIWTRRWISNDYAPEHLILQVREPAALARPGAQRRFGVPRRLVAGDRWATTARAPIMCCRPTATRAPSADFRCADFVKTITVQELSPEGLRRSGPTAVTLAHLEGLDAHAQAVTRRLRCWALDSLVRCRAVALMSWVKALARPEIVALKAYEHAAWEPGLTRLHANELPWRARAMSRSPDSTATPNRSRAR